MTAHLRLVTEPLYTEYRKCINCKHKRDINCYAYTGSSNNRRQVCMTCEPLFTEAELDGFRAWLAKRLGS